MGRDKIIGREAECERLEKCLRADQAQLVIIYGRRRVGKTFLINQFFDGRFDFKLTGAYAEPKETQLRYFITELNRQSGKNTPVPGDWIKAFELLRGYLAILPKTEKRVVFLMKCHGWIHNDPDFCPLLNGFGMIGAVHRRISFS